MNKDQKRIELLGLSWFNILKDEFEKNYMINLNKNLIEEYLLYDDIRPKKEDIFKSFKATPFDKLKCIIIGQDPYPNNHANGIAFSSNIGMTPSLSKIFKELEIEDFADGFRPKTRTTDLKDWTDQGILLLNSRLTIRPSDKNSHKFIGWKEFIYNVTNIITILNPKVPFILMGNDTKNSIDKENFNKLNIETIEVEHPAAACYEDRKWEYGNCFYRVNHFLVKNNIKPIEW